MDEQKGEQTIQLQQAEVATLQTSSTNIENTKTTNTETTGRTKCERYSRIVGYLRPLQQWNKGKQAEWVDRKTFVFGNCGCDKEN